MGNLLIKNGKKVLIKGKKQFLKDSGKQILKDSGNIAAGMIGMDGIVGQKALDIGEKMVDQLMEKQKNLVKIPDLKDVHIDVALLILKEELNLIPTPVIANPGLGYADESENEVMYSEPKFGTKVDPKTPVKVYYLTQEVIDKSKQLLGIKAQGFKTPRVIGVDIYEAREDLENLGLKVTNKLEKPDLKFIEKEDGQVTKITYPNDKKIGSKLKTGDRVWLYYVSEEVILESKLLKDKKDKDGQEKIDKMKKAANDMKNDILDGTVGNAQKVARKIHNPLKKKK